jgi:hypothetical protein
MLPFLQQFNRKPWDLINKPAKTLICQSLVNNNYADTLDEINAWSDILLLENLELLYRSLNHARDTSTMSKLLNLNKRPFWHHYGRDVTY